MANGQKQDGSIVTAEIANGAVTTPKIADLAVTTGKIADGAVTYAKMQDVSATDRLLGRVSSGSGDVEEVVLDTDGTLAANSDDRVPTQKAVKTYVDAAVGGGGGAKYLVTLVDTPNISATTAGTTVTSQSAVTYVPKTATYKIYFAFGTYTNTGSCSSLTIKTSAAQAFVEFIPVVGGSGVSSTRNTLIAANTTVGSLSKGAPFALGDMVIISSSSLSLTAGRPVGTNLNTSNGGAFVYQVNDGTSMTIYGRGYLAEQ